MLNLFKKKNLKENGFSMMELSATVAALSLLATTVVATTGPSNFLAAGLNDLEDVLSSEPSVGHTLVFDGTNWVSQRLAPGFLTDMQLSIVPGAGDVIVFDGTRWINRAPTPPSLSNLSNVNVGSSTYGDSLIWNGTQWVSGSAGIPGEMVALATSSAPEGWLIADGREVSRTTYAALFAAIGTTYGSGNGSTTFNLPDMRGKAPVGLNGEDSDFDSLGKVGGEKEVTLTEAQLPVHTHTQQAHTHAGSTNEAGAHTHTGNTSVGGAHTHTGSWSSGNNHTHTWSEGQGASWSTNTGTETSVVVANANVGSIRQWCCNGGWGGSHNHGIASVSSVGGHTHNLETVSTSGAHTHEVSVNSTTAVNNPTGGGQAHNNLQPYIVLNYAIKF